MSDTEDRLRNQPTPTPKSPGERAVSGFAWSRIRGAMMTAIDIERSATTMRERDARLDAIAAKCESDILAVMLPDATSASVEKVPSDGAIQAVSASAEGMADALLEMFRTLADPRKSIVHLLRAWKASRQTTPTAPTPHETGAEYSTECARCGTQPLNYAEPLQSLGEYLTGLLDEDHWAKAERMLHDIGRLLATPRPDAASASVTDAMVEAAYRVMRDQYRDKALISPTAVREALTAALAAAPLDAGREEDVVAWLVTVDLETRKVHATVTDDVRVADMWRGVSNAIVTPLVRAARRGATG